VSGEHDEVGLLLLGDLEKTLILIYVPSDDRAHRPPFVRQLLPQML
jgi:hypothetical protein